MKQMLIDANQDDEVRVAIIDKNDLIDYESENFKNDRVKGNIYLAKIIRVEPSLQAAFVDYGAKKHGFLAYNEIHPNYFKIPTADKKKLLEQEFNESQNLSINEDDESFIDESFNEDQENGIQKVKGKKDDREGFLSKIVEFFNYKPIDDYPQSRIKKKRPFIKTPKRNKNVIYHKKYSIQEVIKSNQVILIQVVKEERGNKGAAVTTRLSLAGKYCVLMPNTNKGGGISRKIIDFKLRKKLKDVLIKLKIEPGMGAIIRTAGEKMALKEIKRDYNSLIKLWKEITSKTVKSNAPCLIHEEDNLIKRCLRDYFDASFESVLINNKLILSKCKEIVKQFMPNSVKKLKLYKDKKPIFFNYGIEKKIIDINNPNVSLKSGGYLVINQTEALVAIDINSGKFTKNRNIEDTAFQTNLEAAEEISKQIRIRDLAGLIVIDFIDMLDRNHNYKVEKKLKDSLKSDRARVQVGRISNFGLLELSRQRLKVNEDSKISVRCWHCNGYGKVPSTHFLINQLIRVFEELTYDKKKEPVKIICSKELQLLIQKNPNSQVFQKRKENVIIDHDLKYLDFIIYRNNEVILTNKDGEIDTEKLVKLSNGDKKINKNTNDYRIEKEKNLLKDEHVTLNSFKINEESKEENILPTKRKSYRQKVKDFKTNKSKPKGTSKISQNRENLDVIKKKENQEKRQGWWNQ
jgi:ribonuclease E